MHAIIVCNWNSEGSAERNSKCLYERYKHWLSNTS